MLLFKLKRFRFRSVNSFSKTARAEFEGPSECKREGKAGQNRNHNSSHRPGGQAEYREDSCRYLNDDPASNGVLHGRAVNLPTAKLIEKCVNPLSFHSAVLLHRAVCDFNLMAKNCLGCNALWEPRSFMELIRVVSQQLAMRSIIYTLAAQCPVRLGPGISRIGR